MTREKPLLGNRADDDVDKCNLLLMQKKKNEKALSLTDLFPTCSLTFFESMAQKNYFPKINWRCRLLYLPSRN